MLSYNSPIYHLFKPYFKLSTPAAFLLFCAFSISGISLYLLRKSWNFALNFDFTGSAAIGTYSSYLSLSLAFRSAFFASDNSSVSLPVSTSLSAIDLWLELATESLFYDIYIPRFDILLSGNNVGLPVAALILKYSTYCIICSFYSLRALTYLCN